MGKRTEVRGKHYETKNSVEHWDWAINLPYLEGCASKYIGRHQDKNGMEDIKKSLTFIQKICEERYGARMDWHIEVEAVEEGIPREYVNPEVDQTDTRDLY